MTLSWIIGFESSDWTGLSVLLFGSENGVPNNLREFADIKDRGLYPPGINSVLYIATDGNVKRGINMATRKPEPVKPVEQPKTQPPKMKHSMKKLFSLIAFIAFIVGISTASAQYVNGTYTSGFTTYFPAGTDPTNVWNYSGNLDVRKAKTVALMVTIGRNAVGSNCVLNFVGSTDGVNWPTNDVTKFYSVIVPGAVVKYTTVTTNIDVGGLGYLRLYSVDPVFDADSYVTNAGIRYSYKIGYP